MYNIVTSKEYSKQLIEQSEKQKRDERRGDLAFKAFTVVMVGGFASIPVGLIGSEIVHGKSNAAAIERTLGQDGFNKTELTVDGESGYGNLADMASIDLYVGNCVLEGVDVEFVRSSEDNSIVDATGYEWTVQALNQTSSRNNQGNFIAMTYTFESASELQDQLGEDPCATISGLPSAN